MNIYQAWLLNALFWLGVIIAFLGLFMLIMPSRVASLNRRVNKWISTDRFFADLDQPRYKESHFYKWHRFWGVIILLGSAYVFYMLYFRMDVEAIAKLMPVVANFDANVWIYQSLVIILLLMNTVILVLSIIIIIRPSLLKQAESFFNNWIQTGKPLERLNHQYQIPDRILPGNVRLFGGVVLAGGIYIALSTAVVIIK